MFHVLQQLDNSSAPDAADVRTVANGVSFLSAVTKNLASILRDRELQILFTMPIEELEGQDVMSDLITSAFKHLQDTAIQPSNHVLYWAILQLLIALCSTQLYNGSNSVPGVRPPIWYGQAASLVGVPSAGTPLCHFIPPLGAPQGSSVAEVHAALAACSMLRRMCKHAYHHTRHAHCA
jgi:hypothetical protein